LLLALDPEDFVLLATRGVRRGLIPEQLVVAVREGDHARLPVALVVRGTPCLLQDGSTTRGRPSLDPPPTCGVRIEVEPMDVEDANVRLVPPDRLGLAWLFMDLHRAVEPRRVVVVAAAGGGRWARRGEHQESQPSDEGQDSGRLAHWLPPVLISSTCPEVGLCVDALAGRPESTGLQPRNAEMWRRAQTGNAPASVVRKQACVVESLRYRLWFRIAVATCDTCGGGGLLAASALSSRSVSPVRFRAAMVAIVQNSTDDG
jgi:hypothetical protein